MVNIHDTQQIKTIFSKLDANAKPLWGKMSPQHIVEHLSAVVKVSTGQREVKFYLTTEEAAQLKNKLIYGDGQLGPGIKNPLIGDEPPVLRHKSIKDAYAELYNELENFKVYQQKNPDKTHTHPR